MVKIGKLFKFYKAIGHRDVLKLIEDNFGGGEKINEKFDVYKDDLYKIYIPKGIGNKKLPLLTSHTDTVWSERPKRFRVKKNIVMNENRNRGIGADCRNGCYILSETMKTNPDDYIFALFDLEEVGGVGSESVAENLLIKLKKMSNIVIGLDCFDDKIVACYNSNSKRICDDHFDWKFLEYLDDNDWVEDRGYFTDAQILGESLNIPAFVLSIGFTNQHTAGEYSDLRAIENTRKILKKMPKEVF